ncbi:LacI family DNA-binding transcriptional regulator [Coraliomargarita algicola]|uniref:LacI family DNA-binding transcriptional regulator n=1 Tax=Coraliomargarita algicola TaxID=3092156 RepID=A0ABZ0RIS0_9BACT|nr:LacI family DNA-binding transcriptional regulator [Coraliomargarita sp. J2-16]WPJ95373.1 LacI family DNA-binding transcriptional regulator [Coraliomargarita sp. J2-16]
MREIAERIGVSRMTVSKALRGSAGVSEKTRHRIEELAQEMGYVPDPNVSIAMAAVAKTKFTTGERLAFLTTHETEHGWKRFSHIQSCFEGAQQRAAKFGFELEPFWALQPRVDLAKMLYARGINGILIAPTGANLLSNGRRSIDMDWSQFSVVALDELLDDPKVTLVRHSHLAAMFELLYHLEQLGYERIGLSLSRITETRNRHRWTSAYVLWSKFRSGAGEIPIFMHDQSDPEAFEQWVQQHEVDVVIGLPTDFSMLQQAGFQCPEEIGFALLDCQQVAGVDMELSGIDQKAEFLGVTAVDTLIGVMHTRTTGVPESPGHLVCQGHWVEGQSTRKVGAPRGDRSLYEMPLKL